MDIDKVRTALLSAGVDYHTTKQSPEDALSKVLANPQKLGKVGPLAQYAINVYANPEKVEMKPSCRRKLLAELHLFQDKKVSKGPESGPGSTLKKSHATRALIRNLTWDQVNASFEAKMEGYFPGLSCTVPQNCDFCRMVLAVARLLPKSDIADVNAAFGGKWQHWTVFKGNLIFTQDQCCANHGTPHPFLEPIFKFDTLVVKAASKRIARRKEVAQINEMEKREKERALARTTGKSKTVPVCETAHAEPAQAVSEIARPVSPDYDPKSPEILDATPESPKATCSTEPVEKQPVVESDNGVTTESVETVADQVSGDEIMKEETEPQVKRPRLNTVKVT
jgi:hypothetical protein